MLKKFDTNLTAALMPFILRIIGYKTRLVPILKFLEILFGLSLVGLFLLASKLPIYTSIIISLGRELGLIALIFLGLTLSAGIFRRLGFFLFINTLIMPFRRHLGIITYLCALGHFLLNYTLTLLVNQLPIFLGPDILAGISALLLMIPLFLTSNNTAVKYLKLWWGRLHKLVYLVVILVLLHLVLLSSDDAIYAAILLGMEIVSYLVLWYKYLQINQLKQNKI